MKKICIFVLVMFLFISNVYAASYNYVTTIRETTTSNDGYGTIERNTTIIGVTKFTSDQVITASKASAAGANSSHVFYGKNNTMDNFVDADIYIYYGEVGGWYKLDVNNNSTAITDTATLNKLRSQNIYYVNNNEKVVKIDFNYSNLDNIVYGVVPRNNILYLKSSLNTVTIQDKSGNNYKYVLDLDIGKYVLE